MVAGVSWVDMHKLANKEMLSSMKDSGILTGDVDLMMKVYLVCSVLYLLFNIVCLNKNPSMVKTCTKTLPSTTGSNNEPISSFVSKWLLELFISTGVKSSKI